MLFAHKTQENFWHQTLARLAAHFGVNGQVQMHKSCIDPKLQWSQAKNVWYNAAVRTAIYLPVRWFNRLIKH
jgi:hypothetical protein